jgi:4-diphosphocytidyl-2-C-methyl-D-erythritol kinase
MTRALTLRPSAKINLTLHVGPANETGYHDVRTILQSIALHDTLTLTPKRGPFTLSIRQSDVPADRTNLVWRAADALWRAAGRDGDPRDVSVTLDKVIPVAAGLGGGSADAAAALTGLNAIWKLRKTPADLRRVAASLGADVPFFLLGGTAMGLGRGDDLFPLSEVPRFGIVIIKPDFGVSTVEAYRWLDADRASGQAGGTGPHRELAVGWGTGPVALLNDLEAPARRRHPGIGEAIEACLDAGARAAAMTGSGSAVFGVFSESAAPKAARRLRRPGWLVLATRTLSRRESGRRMGL